MNKRGFLQSISGATLGLALGPQLHANPTALVRAADDGDAAFWATVRAQFRLTSDYINLENGYYCFQPEPVLEAFVGNVRAINFAASRYMRTRRDDDRVRVRGRLAALAGCSPEELIVTRNTTESLDTVISGYDWRPGDEAVMANQDYGAMLDMFTQQARRHGLVSRRVDIPMDPRSDADVVQVYANALTARTRLLMIPHIVNITGHILPVRAICEMAHARGVPVLVDGAHAFAQLDYRIAELQCDYYGASLHKWLCAPLGTGLLYVRRDRIAGLWPIYADEGVPADDIRKLNHTGTHPAHTDLTIERAIAFHEALGSARKEARLRYLQRYWTDRVRGNPGIFLRTPADPARACAIATVAVKGSAPGELARVLLERYRIYTVAIDGAGVQGVRVSPQVYTSTPELDTFVRALEELASSG
jgi:selenocysteine lyase/cysteine desulfurase